MDRLKFPGECRFVIGIGVQSQASWARQRRSLRPDHGPDPFLLRRGAHGSASELATFVTRFVRTEMTESRSPAFDLAGAGDPHSL